MKSFNGEGYSKEFVDNFRDVINKIKKENPFIKVINCPDVICEACPHNRGGCTRKGPESESKVKDKDNKFIELLKLSVGNEMKANEVIDLVNREITDREIRKICKDCEWVRHCL